MGPKLLILGLGPLWAIIVSYPLLIVLVQATHSGSTGIIIGSLLAVLGSHLAFALYIAGRARWPQALRLTGIVATSLSTSSGWALTAMLVLFALAESPLYTGTPQERLFDTTLGWPFTWWPAVASWVDTDILLSFPGIDWMWLIFPVSLLTLILTMGSSALTWVIDYWRNGPHQPPSPIPHPPPHD